MCRSSVLLFEAYVTVIVKHQGLAEWICVGETASSAGRGDNL